MKIEFQLADTAEKVPLEYIILETKLDGTRIAAVKEGTKVELINRRGAKKTDQFKEVVDELKKLSFDCILDGEVTGKDFFTLQRRDKTTDPLKMKLLQKTCPVQYHIFDILEIDGQNLTNLPLLERKRILDNNIEDNATIKKVRAESLAALEKKMAAGEIEGYIAKNPNAPYVGRRTKDWIKVKREKVEDAWIIGYTQTDKANREFRSLIIKLPNGDERHVAAGLTQDLIRKLFNEMQSLPYSERKQDGYLCHYLEKAWGRAEISYYPDTTTKFRFPKFMRLKDEV